MMRIEKFTILYRDVTKEGTKIPQEKYCLTGQFPIVDQGQRIIAGWWNDDDGIFKDVPAIIFGDHTRAIKYMEEPFFIGADGVKILRPTNVRDNPKYLYYALQAAKIPKLGYSRHFKVVKELEIRMYSRDEQDEIVRVLEKIDYLIEQRHAETTYLDQLVKSRFIELFGDPQRNPHGYKHTKLSDIATYYNGLTYKPENVAAEGTIVLRSSNIQNSQLDFADTVRVDCAIKERLMVQKNDILMCSRNGSAKLVGKVALIKDIQEPMSFGAFMMIIRSHYFGYLMMYFQMDAFRQQIKTGATTTINQITGRMLDDVTIPLPPMALVDQFATFVEQTDKSKFYIVQMQILLRLLIRAIQQKTTEVLL